MKILLLVLSVAAASSGCVTDTYHSEENGKKADFSRTAIGYNTSASKIDADMKTGKIKVGGLSDDAAPAVAVLGQFLAWMMSHPQAFAAPVSSAQPSLIPEPTGTSNTVVTPATITTTTTVTPTK